MDTWGAALTGAQKVLIKIDIMDYYPRFKNWQHTHILQKAAWIHKIMAESSASVACWAASNENFDMTPMELSEHHSCEKYTRVSCLVFYTLLSSCSRTWTQERNLWKIVASTSYTSLSLKRMKALVSELEGHSSANPMPENNCFARTMRLFPFKMFLHRCLSWRGRQLE